METTQTSIPKGTVVQYHGSIGDCHGRYIITDVTVHRTTGDLRYSLRPLDGDVLMEPLSNVRHTSITRADLIERRRLIRSIVGLLAEIVFDGREGQLKNIDQGKYSFTLDYNPITAAATVASLADRPLSGLRAIEKLLQDL